MPTQVEIGRAGEKIVIEWLTKLGYFTNIDTRPSDSMDLEAYGSVSILLIRVKSAIQPNEPSSLSSDEEAGIKSCAIENSYEAWEAKVQMDENLKLVDKIIWRSLM